MNPEEFQDLLSTKGRELYREMPWRADTRPFYALVSELMLQQTQVERVIPKFEAFIRRFPDEKHLAAASLQEVVVLWNGLGYNRRAKYLHEAAKKIVHDFHGVFPRRYDQIVTLPGVGPGTAGAILVYAFNQPVVFIETNIRTVYFHHFFETGEKVSDTMLRTLIDATLDYERPREFYWALMDYGTWLKKQKVGHIRQSLHYKKQPPLQGSIRQVRGQIIKALSEGDKTKQQLKIELVADARFDPALQGLVRDGLVEHTKQLFHLTK